MLDGQKASDYLAHTAPDLLLLDLHLPHVNGQSIIKQLAVDPQHQQTKIIVVTADIFLPEDFQKTYPTVQAVLFKPVPVGKLVAMVKSLLQDS